MLTFWFACGGFISAAMAGVWGYRQRGWWLAILSAIVTLLAWAVVSVLFIMYVVSQMPYPM
jgi:hypothetical protein